MADLDALPPHIKGEIIDGVLYARPRPRGVHQDLVGLVHADLVAPFRRQRGGPGGWGILPEPGIEFPGAPEGSPDLAGWRPVDTDARLVMASVLENGRWSELGVWSDETEARIPPFDAVPLDVAAWWLGDPADGG